MLRGGWDMDTGQGYSRQRKQQVPRPWVRLEGPERKQGEDEMNEDGSNGIRHVETGSHVRS